MDEKFNRDDDFFRRAMESERNVNDSKEQHIGKDPESMLKQRFAKSIMGISGLYSTGKFCKSCDAIADKIIEDLTEKLNKYKEVKANIAETMAYEKSRHRLITEIVMAAQKLDYYKIMSLASSFSSLANALGDDEERMQESIKGIVDNYGTYPKDCDVKDDD